MKKSQLQLFEFEKAQNPIIQRINHLIERRKKNATILFYGDVGCGKSETAISIALDLDKTFDIDRIVFSIKDLLAKAREFGSHSRGKVIILDELANEEGADSRNSLSDINKQISYVTTVARAKGFILFYIAPLISQMDKRIRLIGTTAYVRMIGVNFDEKYADAEFQWTFIGRRGDIVLTPHPRIRIKKLEEFKQVKFVRFPKCSNQELLKAYAEKKDTFINKVIDTAFNKIDSKDKKAAELEKKSMEKLLEQARECKSEVMSGGRYAMALISKKLDVGLKKATAIAGVLNKELKNKPPPQA